MQKTSQGEIAENKMQLRSVKETNSKLDLKIHELHEQIKLENRRMHDLATFYTDAQRKRCLLLAIGYMHSRYGKILSFSAALNQCLFFKS